MRSGLSCRTNQPPRGPLDFPEGATAPVQAPAYFGRQLTSAAAFGTRDGAQLRFFNGKYWLLGGWDPILPNAWSATDVTTNQVWSSPDLVTWTLELAHDASAPTSGPGARWLPRHTFGTAVFDGYLWVIGGDTVLGAVPTDVWRSADGTTWERVAATSPWAYLSILGVFNGALHIMGGTTDASQHRSSSDGATWTDLPALPFSRSSVTQAVVAFGRMFVIGGVDGDGVTQKNDTWKYDGSTWTQQSAAAVWSAREWIATAAYDEKLWVLTGKSGVANAGGLFNSDDGGVTWTSLPMYPYPPSHADGITVTDDGIALASGAGLPGSTYLISRLPTDPSVTMATIAWRLWIDGAQYNPITNQVFGKASAGTSGSKTMGATGGPTSGLINGRPTIILDGANDVLRYTDGAEVADIIGAAAWCVSFVGKINSSTADSGTPWVNPGLGCDSPGYWSAAGIRSSNPLTAYQDDGAVKTAAKTWTAGALVLVQVRFNGTQLQIRTGKGAWTTTAAGNIASLSGAFHIGANFNLLQFAGLELCEYAATNLAPSDATLDLAADDMIAKWGVAA